MKTVWDRIRKFFGKPGLVDLLLVAGVLCLVLLTCNGCPGKDDGTNRDPYDSVLDAQAQANREYQYKVDSLTVVVGYKDAEIMTLQKTKEVFKTIADKQKQETQKYVNLYLWAKSQLDTTVMITSCDSLVDEYQILAGINETERRLADSIISEQAKAISTRDDIIGVQRQQIKSNEAFMFKSDSLYNKLFQYSMKVEKKHQRQKKITWGAAIVAFVLGVIAAK